MKMNKMAAATVVGLLLVGCGGGDDDDAGAGASASGVGGYRCSDFTRQTDAQAVYRLGATQLDSDRDGIACESLP